MKSSLYRFFYSLTLLCTITVVFAQIPERPNPPRLVNDFANIIPDNYEQQLETKLVKYNRSTSTQIAVVSVVSLGGDAPFNVAQEILSTWGVGQKGKDNGIVILIAPNERKTFISTGYGVEALLTDALARRVIEAYMIPNFKQGNYYGGINVALDIIKDILKGNFKADKVDPATKFEDKLIIFMFIAFFVFVFIVLPILSARNRGRYTYTRRGVNTFNGPSGGPIFFPSNSSGGSYQDFSSGSGSFGGGGDSFDFGGFGGGDGGGGGAGGEW